MPAHGYLCTVCFTENFDHHCPWVSVDMCHSPVVVLSLSLPLFLSPSLPLFLFKIVRTIWPSLSSGKPLLIFIWVTWLSNYWLHKANIQYSNHRMGRIFCCLSWFPPHPCAVWISILRYPIGWWCHVTCVAIMWHHMTPGWQLCGQEKLPVLLPLLGHHHRDVTLCHGVQRGSGRRR